MILLIDAGNTRIKWALLDPAAGKDQICQRMPWLTGGAVMHEQFSQLGTDWRQCLKHGPISRVSISNVAGPAMRARLQALIEALPLACPPEIAWFASQPDLAGICNGYRDHAQLGCDRFASMIGAHALFPGQALVIATCGTATTVDAVMEDGYFAGGMILPGLGLMASSLARNTAQLPQVTPSDVTALFADNTDDAIVSGCLAAQAGAIERACVLHPAHADAGREVQCILSGGAAAYIGPQLSVAYRFVDNLVLIGLATVALHPDHGHGFITATGKV